MTLRRAPLPLAAPGLRLGFACQTYSWQMNLARYADRFDVVASEVAGAGFGAIEAESVMLGRFSDPGRLRDLLEGLDLQLAALTLVAAWRGPSESPAERDLADQLIGLTRAFPGAKLNLCQDPQGTRDDLRAQQEACLSCVAEVAARASLAGVSSTFHPNSPAASKFRTAEDYAFLLAHLPDGVGFTPDLGHVAKGGMDGLEVVKRYRPAIDHLHLKDMAPDGAWVGTGLGVVPIQPAVEYLSSTGYTGWVVLEDESPAAAEAPAEAAIRNCAYVRAQLMVDREEGQ